MVGTAVYIHTPGGFSLSKMAAKFDKGIGVPQHGAQLEHGDRAGEDGPTQIK